MNMEDESTSAAGGVSSRFHSTNFGFVTLLSTVLKLGGENLAAPPDAAVTAFDMLVKVPPAANCCWNAALIAAALENTFPGAVGAALVIARLLFTNYTGCVC